MAPRHAIITGGSSGIGLALAEMLAAQGWRLTLIGRNRERLDAAREQLTIYPGECCATSADVTERSAIKAAISDAITRFGTPELVVTSAGIAQPGHFTDLPDELFEQAMRVNYFGTLHTLRAVMPALVAQQRGHIVMIASGAALVGIYGYSAYAPSKYAVRGLAEVLRSEIKPHGIGISVVYPPDTDTPQLAQEERIKPAETRAITATARTWSAEAVAAAILRGVRRERFVIAPGWEMGLLARIHSLIDPILQRYFDHLIARVRKGGR